MDTSTLIEIGAGAAALISGAFAFWRRSHGAAGKLDDHECPKVYALAFHQRKVFEKELEALRSDIGADACNVFYAENGGEKPKPGESDKLYYSMLVSAVDNRYQNLEEAFQRAHLDAWGESLMLDISNPDGAGSRRTTVETLQPGTRIRDAFTAYGIKGSWEIAIGYRRIDGWKWFWLSCLYYDREPPVNLTETQREAIRATVVSLDQELRFVERWLAK